MKTVKVKFVGFWDFYDFKKSLVCKAISKNYNLVESEDPDYIICSLFTFLHHEYCQYPQVRIFLSEENYLPNFNLVDYAISGYPLSLSDRHVYMPGCIDDFGHCESLAAKERHYDASFLETKTLFANFIASHESEHNFRGDFFKKLCAYKKVTSAGSYLNNMPNGETVDWKDDSKQSLQRKCKFTLCFESTSHNEFITEKITDAFMADTIPVYFGSTAAKDIFNPKAFIDCSDYDSFDDVIAKIIEIDNDDELFLEMMNQPIFNNPNFVQERLAALETFFCNIFEQPVEKAYRRSRVYSPKRDEDNINTCTAHWNEIRKGTLVKSEIYHKLMNAHGHKLPKDKWRDFCFEISRLPNLIISALLGKKLYGKLKSKLKARH